MSMLSHKTPPPACAIVIFGANGDLTKRLIIPALYNLARTNLLPKSLALVGVDHNKKTNEEWTAQLKEFLGQVLAKNNEEIDEALWGQVPWRGDSHRKVSVIEREILQVTARQDECVRERYRNGYIT